MKAEDAVFLTYKSLYYELIAAVDNDRHAERMLETFLRLNSLKTSRTSSRIFLSGWFAGTRASGEMYENSPPWSTNAPRMQASADS